MATTLLTEMKVDYNDKSAPALEEIDIAKDVCAVAVVGKFFISETLRIIV